MKNIRILRMVILLLVCANLFLMFKQYWKPKHPPILSQVVQAADVQAQALDKEMHRHHRAIVKWTQKQYVLRQKLVHSKPQEEQIRKTLLDQISQCQRTIDSTTIAHFDRVDALCTAPQKKRFHQFRKRLLQPHHFKN